MNKKKRRVIGVVALLAIVALLVSGSVVLGGISQGPVIGDSNLPNTTPLPTAPEQPPAEPTEESPASQAYISYSTKLAGLICEVSTEGKVTPELVTRYNAIRDQILADPLFDDESGKAFRADVSTAAEGFAADVDKPLDQETLDGIKTQCGTSE